MTKPILITVIIPVYNVEKYLRKCLDSIINQTYYHLEIIIVDDGSKDSSGQICDEYVSKDSRIKVIHKKNGGLSSARNAGLDIASGDYVMFVDSDDFVELDFCRKALSVSLEKEADIVSFGYYEVLENGAQRIIKTNNPRYVSSAVGIKELIVKKDKIYNLAWNKLYKAVLFENIRYPLGKTYEDQATTYLLFHKANRIYVDDSVLYNYIFRSNSISADWNKPESIIDRFSIWMDRLVFIRTYYPELEKDQIKQLVNEAIKGFFKLTGIRKYKKAIKLFSRFLVDNKTIVQQLNNDKIIKIFYSNRPLFYLYCYYFRIRYSKH